jgi:hypothetical protein
VKQYRAVFVVVSIVVLVSASILAERLASGTPIDLDTYVGTGCACVDMGDCGGVECTAYPGACNSCPTTKSKACAAGGWVVVCTTTGSANCGNGGLGSCTYQLLCSPTNPQNCGTYNTCM